MNPKLALYTELYERGLAYDSLYEFAKQAWPLIEGGREFFPGRHIEAICEHLEAVYYRHIRNLLVNIPPRCMKSSLTSVLFPAWVWMRAPDTQLLVASYALDLSQRDVMKCRRIIASEWYRTRWGHMFNPAGDQNTKRKFENDKTGFIQAISIGGGNTGFGGDILIADDPNSVKDVLSDVVREGANNWFSSIWSTRLNNRKTGCRIVQQQRVHEKDVSGHILANDLDNNWVKLILPMEFEEKRRAVTVKLPSTKGKVWQDWRKKEGELLWPDNFNAKAVADIKNELRSKGGEYAIAGQLQQRPSPEDGGIIKRSWFKIWKTPAPPKLIKVMQSWDTALEAKDSSCYSVCITLGLFLDSNKLVNLILMNVWRQRAEFPELREAAKKLQQDYRFDGSEDFKVLKGYVPDVVLVEAKVSGISLIQELRRAGVSALRFDPNKYGDKDARVRMITHYLEAGLLWVPAKPPNYDNLRPFAERFVEECITFPRGEYRDQVDTLSQALIYLSKNGDLRHPDEKKRGAPKAIRADTTFYGVD